MFMEKFMVNLEYDIKTTDGYNLIFLRGVLTFRNSDQLIDDIKEKIDFKKVVILDLECFEDIDSTGIGVLMKIKTELDKNNISLYGINLNEKIIRTFKLVGFSKHIKILNNTSIKNYLNNKPVI
jgi:anti-anti-sigma factor